MIDASLCLKLGHNYISIASIDSFTGTVSQCFRCEKKGPPHHLNDYRWVKTRMGTLCEDALRMMIASPRPSPGKSRRVIRSLRDMEKHFKKVTLNRVEFGLPTPDASLCLDYIQESICELVLVAEVLADIHGWPVTWE